MLPTDPKERKTYPVYSGVFKYFPDALIDVSHVSFVGNEQHNPGDPLWWNRAKSKDQEDAAFRHLLDRLRGKFDTDKQRHLAKAAWRILAALQLEIEADEQVEQTVAPPQEAKSKCPFHSDMAVCSACMPECFNNQWGV